MKRLLLILAFLLAPQLALADYTINLGSNASLVNFTDLSTGNNFGISQLFTTVGAGTICTIQVSLLKTGTPSGNVTMDIFAASGQDPTGASLGQTVIGASTVGTSQSLNTFTFTPCVSISATTNYVFVVERTDYSGGSIKTGGTVGGGDTSDYTDNGTVWLDLAQTHYANVYVTTASAFQPFISFLPSLWLFH